MKKQEKQITQTKKQVPTSNKPTTFWEASMKHQGLVQIIDMKAVMK